MIGSNDRHRPGNRRQIFIILVNVIIIRIIFLFQIFQQIFLLFFRVNFLQINLLIIHNLVILLILLLRLLLILHLIDVILFILHLFILRFVFFTWIFFTFTGLASSSTTKTLFCFWLCWFILIYFLIDSQLWYFLCFNLRQESLHLSIMLIFEIEPDLYSNFRHGAKMMIIIINSFSIYIITIKMINYQEITLYR